MPSRETTPEEKLLAVIQQSKEPQAASAEEPPAAPAAPAPARPAAADPAPADAKKLKLASAGDSPSMAEAQAATATAADGTRGAGETAEAAPPAGSKSVPSARGSGPMTVTFVHRFLGLVVVLVLLLFVLYSIASVKPDVARAAAAQAAEIGSAPAAAPLVNRGPYPPVTNFIDRVAGRNIFLPGGVSPVGTNAPPKAGGELGLKLVGVSIDSVSAQDSMAIIKSKTGSQTYFVKQGQTVGETGATLDRIFPDHVIVKYQRQELELR